MAAFQNSLTEEIFTAFQTKAHPASSYGQPVWVKKGTGEAFDLFGMILLEMTQDDFDSVELGFYEYFEKELVVIDYDEENVAEEFWGEIFARYNAALDSGVDDRIARILAIHLPYTCTKDEAKEIYKYAIQIPGYFSDDEKAPEALIGFE